MRIVVVGCGGVGGILAARLTKAGHDVTPVTANPEISTALSNHGYRVRELDGTEWSVPTARPPAHAFERRMHGSPFDLCILATKATTCSAAAESARPHLRATSPVLCCQNGLPEAIVAPIVGRERVLGCVVSFGATMEEPGLYVVTARGGLRLGRPFAESPDPAAWLGVLGAAAPTMVVPDLAAVRWSKLALNCASSTLGLIGGVKLGSLLRRRFVRRLVLEIWTEVAAVAAATGHGMEPIGGTFDIGRMALTPRERARPLLSPSLAIKHAFLIGVGFKYRSMRSSMLVALERGRAPEIDALNGEIVRRGAAAGVPTPVNERLVATVHCIVAGAERPSMRLLREVSEGVSATPRASIGPRSLPRPPETPDLDRTERAGARTQSLQSE
jgi:2-dehydropantoate 2-reductase